MTSTPSFVPVDQVRLIDMPDDPEFGEYFIAQNGVRYYWDGVKWMLADDTSIALWRYDVTDQTLTPAISGVGIKSNDDIGARSAAMQAEGYDIEVLPKLKHWL